MAAIRQAIMIRNPWAMMSEDETTINPELVHGDVAEQLEQLKWWGEALKAAR
jgi:hypothetical protein